MPGKDINEPSEFVLRMKRIRTLSCHFNIGWHRLLYEGTPPRLVVRYRRSHRSR